VTGKLIAKLYNLPVIEVSAWKDLVGQLVDLDLVAYEEFSDEGDYWDIELQGMGYTLRLLPSKPEELS
jgi:hypothetical protein